MSPIMKSDIECRRLAGRCTDGAERGKGQLFHAVPTISNTALCGAKPGRHSAGWSETVGQDITCPKCLRKLQRMV